MYSRENWDECKRVYGLWRERLISAKPGMYFLMHTGTKKISFGNIDDGHGGLQDAGLNHERLHGKLQGEYYGIRIPKTKKPGH